MPRSGPAGLLPERPGVTVGVVLTLLVLGVVAFHLRLAVLARIDVPFVDAWPVLHRIMLLQTGGISWPGYLFGGHGAHLHSIIYLLALLDYEFLGGQQELQAVALLTTVLLHTLFVAWLLARYGLRRGHPTLHVALATLAAAALIPSLADWQSMLLPFQAVLTASRLAYVVLLCLLARAMLGQRPRLYALAMLAALPAVTFHGTGQIFALCVLILHLLLRQRGWRLAAGVLPLICALSMQAIFSPGGELAGLGRVLSPAAVPAVLLAVCTYFGSPFFILSGLIGLEGVLCIGAAVAGATVVLTLLALRRLLRADSWSPYTWFRRLRVPASAAEPADADLAFFATLGLLLLMSAAAAAMFWLIRAEAAGVPAWRLLAAESRYAAYATLAALMPLAAWLYLPPRTGWPAVPRFGPLAWSAVLLALGLGGSFYTARTRTLGERTDLALAALSVGLPPGLPETDIVWPGFANWYWVDELPRTVRWLRASHTGPWRDLPAFHARGGPDFAAYPLDVTQREPLPAERAPGWCRLSAVLPTWERPLPGRRRVVPVTTSEGIVVGYGVLLRHGRTRATRDLLGYVACAAGDPAALFLPRDDRR